MYQPIMPGEVLAYSMTFIAMNPALPLLQVNRVGRQIPMDNSMTIGVEIQALLPDRRGSQHKRRERRIESFAHLVGACHYRPVIGALVAKAQRKPLPHPLIMDLNSGSRWINGNVVHMRSRSA